MSLVRANRELNHLALHDTLTGLPNRALIVDRIEQMLARSRRDRSPIAVLFLDLDNFKEVNDTLGHAARDGLLMGVGSRLTSALREGDTVGRLGGDEFVVVAQGDSLAAGAEVVAARILDALAAPFEIIDSDSPLSVTASIGIAQDWLATPDELLHDGTSPSMRPRPPARTVPSSSPLPCRMRSTITEISSWTCRRHWSVASSSFSTSRWSTSRRERSSAWRPSYVGSALFGACSARFVRPRAGGERADRAGWPLGAGGSVSSRSRVAEGGPPLHCRDQRFRQADGARPDRRRCSKSPARQ